MKTIFMKLSRNKINPFSLFMAVVLLSLNACLSDPDLEFEGYADVYIVKKTVNGSTKYSPYYFVYSNTALNSAVVTLPGATGPLSLEPYLSDNFIFSNKPTDSNLTSSIPAAGSYSFAVTTKEGEAHVITDNLTSSEIPVPELTEASFNTTSGSISVKWKAIATASAYNLKLYKQSGDLVFSSALFVITKTELLIDQATTGWVVGNPVLNTTYRLELNAYKFEEGATDQNYSYNVQCVAVTETNVTWLQ